MAKSNCQLKRISLLTVLLSLSLGACSTLTPSEKYHKKATSAGLISDEVYVHQYRLQIYKNQEKESGRIHVYLEGDGSPFFRKQYIKHDPTPINPVAINLMLLDESPSLLLGRPCYHKTLNTAVSACNESNLWTTGRYSHQVVTTLATALKQLAPSPKKLTLIGFSGGGTLAMLLSTRLENVTHVVTINANLDIDAWAEHHAYTLLSSSLNPIDQLSDYQKSDVFFHHLIGSKDQNVISAHWLKAFSSLPKTQISHLHNFDHVCCWNTIWKEFLTTQLAQ